MKKFLKIILRKSSTVLNYLISETLIKKIILIFYNIDIKNRVDIRLVEQKHKEIFDILGKELKRSLRVYKEYEIRKIAVDLALTNAKNSLSNEELYNLEFGVYKGETSNYFSKFFDKLYAFDWFEGLPTEWEGTLPKGFFNLNKKIPKLNPNVEPVVGLVENTLDDFLNKHNPSINFVHMDLDLYEPSLYTLKKIKPYLKKGAIIIFDQLYNYINWTEGEYKALKESFGESEFRYRSFNMHGEQVVIEFL